MGGGRGRIGPAAALDHPVRLDLRRALLAADTVGLEVGPAAVPFPADRPGLFED